MLTGKKIALFGTGGIGLIVTAGAAALNFVETKKEKSDFDFDVLKITEKRDYSSLVKSYMKVKRKYYPENDIFIFNKNTDKGLL